MQELCQTIQEFLSAHGIPDELVVFIISVLPILECRLGMFTAIVLLQMNVFKGFIISFLGNILPIPFILLLINPMLVCISSTKESIEPLSALSVWGVLILLESFAFVSRAK